MVDVNLSINGKKKTFTCSKPSMRNGGCEKRLCDWATRARQGSCQIW